MYEKRIKKGIGNIIIIFDFKCLETEVHKNNPNNTKASADI